MTERIYECYAELWKFGIPQEMDGEGMTLRELLIRTDVYDYSYDNLSDRALIGYLREYRGKYLIEVE